MNCDDGLDSATILSLIRLSVAVQFACAKTLLHFIVLKDAEPAEPMSVEFFAAHQSLKDILNQVDVLIAGIDVQVLCDTVVELKFGEPAEHALTRAELKQYATKLLCHLAKGKALSDVLGMTVRVECVDTLNIRHTKFCIIYPQDWIEMTAAEEFLEQNSDDIIKKIAENPNHESIQGDLDFLQRAVDHVETVALPALSPDRVIALKAHIASMKNAVLKARVHVASTSVLDLIAVRTTPRQPLSELPMELCEEVCGYIVILHGELEMWEPQGHDWMGDMNSLQAIEIPALHKALLARLALRIGRFRELSVSGVGEEGIQDVD